MKTKIMRRLRVAMAALALLTPFAAARADEPGDTSTTVWSGKINVPGMVLDIVVRFAGLDSDAPTAKIDIPAQGVKGLALSDVAVSVSALKFKLPISTAAEFELKVAEGGREAEGTMRQAGMTFPVSLKRTTEAAAANVGPARPQNPKKPYPYRLKSVSFRNEKDGIEFGGTLTLPKRRPPFAAVVLISGSGSQDRDETIVGHKPFLVIADYLTRRGMAVLRFDDRGIGASTCDPVKLQSTTTEDIANDVRAAISFLRSRDDIDGKRIALMGHSEGGIIAPMIAAEDKTIAAIVMLAGPGVPGRKVLSGQLERINAKSGVPAANVAAQVKAQQKWMDLFTADASPDDVKAALRELIRLQLDAVGRGKNEAEIDTTLALTMKSEGNAWMKYFIKHDPVPALRKVTCPVLALNGSLDTQVIADDNLGPIRAALEAGGNKDFRVRELEGLNHLFQHAKTGIPAEYGVIDETFAPGALKVISKWLRPHLHIESPKKKKRSAKP